MDSLSAKVAELESENGKLRERLRVLEKSRSPLGELPTPPRAAVRHKEAERQDAADSPQPAAEQVLHYLRTVLGFTVRHRGNTLVLRSVYSFCEEDVFEIEVKDNKLLLKNTEYLGEWGEHLNTYVRAGKSYSAFFAAVTLDLFNKKTFG